jgi:aspartate/glutamate racemase
MKKLAVIHTTPVTVETFKALAAEALPGYEVVNFVDDSILPQLRDNGGDVAQVEDRLLHYARFAEQVGADVILSACSSVGEVAAKMRQQVSVPVVRVDDAMAEQAIQRGQRVGVAATLGTTLAPTLALLRAKAEASGKDVTFEARVVDSAYQKLIAGDRDGHDAILAAALEEMAKTNDVIVLAQASMARVLPNLPERIQGKFLTSPRLAMGQVKTALGL